MRNMATGQEGDELSELPADRDSRVSDRRASKVPAYLSRDPGSIACRQIRDQGKSIARHQIAVILGLFGPPRPPHLRRKRPDIVVAWLDDLHPLTS